MADRGPLVDAADDLYRAITHPSWWNKEKQQVSSAAFSYPSFSVDIARLTTERETLKRFDARSGLVVFNCGNANLCGFAIHHEADPDYPQNLAHANAYCDTYNSDRKKRAR